MSKYVVDPKIVETLKKCTDLIRPLVKPEHFSACNNSVRCGGLELYVDEDGDTGVHIIIRGAVVGTTIDDDFYNQVVSIVRDHIEVGDVEIIID